MLNTYSDGFNISFKHLRACSQSIVILLKCQSGRDWCGSVGWALSRKLKGRQFHSQSVHMPGSWARSPVGGWQEATNQCSSPSLSASPLSKIQSINTVLEMSISSCHSAARSLQPSLAAQCGSPDPSRGLPRCLITFPGCFPSPFKTSLKKHVRYLLGMLALHSLSLPTTL